MFEFKHIVSKPTGKLNHMVFIYENFSMFHKYKLPSLFDFSTRCRIITNQICLKRSFFFFHINITQYIGLKSHINSYYHPITMLSFIGKFQIPTKYYHAQYLFDQHELISWTIRWWYKRQNILWKKNPYISNYHELWRWNFLPANLKRTVTFRSK